MFDAVIFNVATYQVHVAFFSEIFDRVNIHCIIREVETVSESLTAVNMAVNDELSGYRL